MSTLGERIKSAREANGLLQNDLARLIGVKSSGVISNWEKDLNKPDAEKIVKLCSVLDISVSFLLDYYGKSAFEFSALEEEHIKKYRELDPHGKKMVDFTLQEEWERSTAAGAQVLNFPDQEPEHLISNAAHVRTDIRIPDDVDISEEDIMDDENF